MLDQNLAQHFKHLDLPTDEADIAGNPFVGPFHIEDKSVDEKVSEIRMFVELVIYFVCFVTFIYMCCVFV